MSCDLQRAAPWTLVRVFEQNHRLGWPPGGNGALGSVLGDATAAQLVFLLHQGGRSSTRELPGPAMVESSQLSPASPPSGGSVPSLPCRAALQRGRQAQGLSSPPRSPLFVKVAFHCSLPQAVPAPALSSPFSHLFSRIRFSRPGPCHTPSVSRPS